ncbi:TRAP transporter substrate-binding protein [Haloferax namakaokahaiae]|uniref:TRAP transporter substrate-binding protein n=1 Tax=Haloferax namakaokahaiae TaxID=1748331 RepID=A0ABD5ZJ48_9EURY
MAQQEQPATRRSILKRSGVALSVGTVGLAGCTGSNSGGGNDTTDGDSSGGNDDTQTDSGGSGGEEVTIDLATTQPPENIMVKAISEHFIDEIESKTDGRISVNLQAATLGGSEDNMSALESGTVDIVSESPPTMAQRFAPEYSFAGDPFVIANMDHYKAVQEEYLMPEDGLNGILMENGLRLGDSFRWGNRGFTSNFPVKTPEDVQDVKLRLPQFETWTSVWGEIGAQPTPVPFDELYSALQTGVADASEGPIAQFMSTSLYEVQSHFSVTNHLLGVNHFILNDDFYQGLSGEDQDLVMSTIEEATGNITQTIRDNEQELYDQARDEGATIIQRDEIDRQAFVDAGMPALEELSESKWAADINNVLDLA